MLGNYNLSRDWIQAMDLDELSISRTKLPKKQEKEASSAAKEFSRHCEEQSSRQSNPVLNPASLQTIQDLQARKTSALDCHAPLAMTNTTTSRSLADNATTLDELKLIVSNFDGCEIKKAATNTVFGDGMRDAKIMVIGEAPGASEDALGVPFCGDSGKLLDNMLKSIGLYRDKNFYITNTIFWRPPANRAPTPEEIEICRPFVEKHIALINPSLLILVGATAVTSLLGNHLQISKVRQEYYMYNNQYLKSPITTTAIFHPAYLLRQPMQKKTSWYDLLKIKGYIDENVTLD